MILPIILMLLFIFSIVTFFIQKGEASLNCFFMSLAIIAPLVISIISHTSDLSLVRLGQSLIEIRQQAINDIDTQLGKIEFSQTSLMNNDSPAKSLIETKARFITELTEEKLRIQKAKISIESRSIGLFKMVVWIYNKK